MHIVSSDQFSVGDIDEIFESAARMKKTLATAGGREKLAKKYPGRQVATLFYQPSTRTRLSFETAALKLGMGVVGTEAAMAFSSAAKGETIEDTVRVLNQYQLDAIVIRYHEVGGAKRAAAVSSVPIINAGDGPGEHPTQSLLDAYTIKASHGRLSGLKVVMGGDLKFSRTVRSLCYVLSKYKDNHIVFVSIPDFQIPKDVTDNLKRTDTSFELTTDMSKAFADADVVYWTRLQKEYLKDAKQLPKGGLVIDKQSLKLMPKHTIIMHPLPRVDEITTDVDSDHRAKYFEQAGNGLYIRMALFDGIMNGRA
ncbi:TPA: aspartate carbamoyltransferase [Candidatus Saccharibacteria bacterium]|nr:aspartate carbamoyltransferase [Candidatus Saccharibacteria bacterium]